MPTFERIQREIGNREMSVVYEPTEHRLDFYKKLQLSMAAKIVLWEDRDKNGYAKTLHANGTWEKIADIQNNYRVQKGESTRRFDDEKNNNELNVEQLIGRLNAIENKLLLTENRHLKARQMISQVYDDIESYSHIS